MSIIPFIVGGAAIGGVVAFAMHERKAAAAAGDSKNRHGSAEPPPLTPGSVDLDEYNANASDEPNGPNVPDGNVTSAQSGQAVSNPFSPNGQHAAQANSNNLGSVTIQPVTGGPPPGTVVVVDPAHGNGSGLPYSKKGMGLAATIGGNISGITRADTTALYRDYGPITGVTI